MRRRCVKLTGDEQWIHVDPERAATTTIGRTIQDGFPQGGVSAPGRSTSCPG
jgi:acyl dehydratase